MTDTAPPDDDTAALRDAIAALTLRLDQIEAQLARPSTRAAAETRFSNAWKALRHGAEESGSAASPRGRGGLLGPLLWICAALLALFVAVELADEVVGILWHLDGLID